MKIDLNKWLSGFVKDRYNVNSVGGLSSLTGAQVGPNGIVDFVGLSTAAGISSVAYPFPQLFLGDQYRLLGYGTSVKYAPSGWASSTAFPIYKPSDYTALSTVGSPTGTITSGGVWHFADFGGSWFMFNGVSQVFYIPGIGMFADNSRFAKTGCAHHGRLVMGGMANYIGTAWNTKTKTFRTKGTADSVAPKDNWIWWSSIGLEDTQWMHFDWMLDIDKFSRMVNRNEFGFMAMPFEGSILAVKELGEYVIAYGQEDAAAVTWKGGIPQVILLPGMGIYDRGSVGGNSEKHLIVGYTGFMSFLNKDLSIEPLDYSRLTTLNTVNIQHDAHEDRYFISNATSDELLLTKWGMGRSPDRVSGIVCDKGKAYGARIDAGADYFYLTTGWIRPDGTMHTAVRVLVDCDDWGSLKCLVGARREIGDTAWGSGYVNLKEGGQADIEVSGVEFYVTVSWQDTTRQTTSIRGITLELLDSRRLDFGDLIA